MSKYVFKVNISPFEVLVELKKHMDADLVHEEILDVGDGKVVATLVFERYYFRTSNRAALMVILDNLEGSTDLRVISTGSSQGVIFNFDWGAASDYIESVRKSLKEYIIQEDE